jgi:hypothetical protein
MGRCFIAVCPTTFSIFSHQVTGSRLSRGTVMHTYNWAVSLLLVESTVNIWSRYAHTHSLWIFIPSSKNIRGGSNILLLFPGFFSTPKYKKISTHTHTHTGWAMLHRGNRHIRGDKYYRLCVYIFSPIFIPRIFSTPPLPSINVKTFRIYSVVVVCGICVNDETDV